MKRQIRIGLTMLASAATIVLFQNCGQQQNSNEASTAKSVSLASESIPDTGDRCLIKLVGEPGIDGTGHTIGLSRQECMDWGKQMFTNNNGKWDVSVYKFSASDVGLSDSSAANDIALRALQTLQPIVVYR